LRFCRTGWHTPLFLKMTNEALDARTQPVEALADGVLHLAVALGRDLRRRATILQVVADRVAVITLVRQHRARVAVALLHQLIVGRHIMGFTCCQYDTDGKACGIAAEMEFGGEPAARTAKCLKLNPAFLAGSAAMRPGSWCCRSSATHSRHGAPVRQIQNTPSNTRRWLAGGRPPRNEAVVRKGPTTAHSSSVI
jgi:hypothetical protein